MTAQTFSGDDLLCLSASIAATLDAVTDRTPSIAADFNRCMVAAPGAIGRRPYDLNDAELDELAEMVADAIAGRAS